MDQPAITVAICTYRREQPLRAALESLCACEPIDQRWELIVVDNAAEDAVRELVSGFTDRLPVRYVAEPTTGTSHARNRAVREAKAPVILFTDDDVTFDASWLSRMAGAIAAHGSYDFWGGRVEPVWQAAAPRWFDLDQCPMLGDCIVRYQQGEQPRPWNPDGPQHDPPFYTANLALRIERIIDAGHFDTTVGHSGAKRMGMEDSLMVQAIAAAGGRGWYAADAVVHHPVPAERLTRSFARQFAWRQGWLSARTHRRPRIPRWYYKVALGKLGGGAWRWLTGALSMNPARRFAGWYVMVFNCSKLYHALRGGDDR